MKSIRSNLVLAVLSVMTLTVFLSSLRGYQASIKTVESIFDEQLAGVASLLLAAGDNASNYDEPASQPYLFQIWSADGQQQLAGNSVGEAFAALQQGYSYYNIYGYRWRVYVEQDMASQRWLMVGERSDLRFSLAETLVLESIIPVIISLPLAALLIWWLIGSGLSPLKRVAKELAAKQADDLSQLQYSQLPTELTGLIASVNALFQRLDTAFRRERHFASDAAHELRTPISALKVNLYNLRQQAEVDPRLAASLEADLARLEHIVEQTLLLYRTSPDSFTPQIQAVDLAKLLREQVSLLYGKFEAKQQLIELAELPAVWVQGNENFLSILISNLLVNANKYVPDKGRIRGLLRSSDGGVELVIQDSGEGIAEHDHERVFDRFYRVGSDRHDSGASGCGLGLAISKHIAELHHATISFRQLEQTSDAAYGFEVCVRFPHSDTVTARLGG